MAAKPVVICPSWMLPGWVGLDKRDLVWVPASQTHRAGAVQPPAALIEQFVALGDATAAAIVDFARRYGTLHLCSHGLPTSHNPGDLSTPPFSALAHGTLALASGCQLVRSSLHDRKRSVTVCREPLATWRRYARIASLTLEATRALQRSEAVGAATWEALLGTDLEAADDAQRLSFVVRAWLRTCDVRVGFDWAAAARPTFVAGSLLGAVALDIAFTAGGEGAVSCSACGAPFVPTRRPARGRRVYCPTCRESGVPGRDAARDYWHRKGKYRKKRSEPS